MRLALFLRCCLVVAVAIALGGQTLAHAPYSTIRTAGHCIDMHSAGIDHSEMGHSSRGHEDHASATSHSEHQAPSGKHDIGKCSVLCCAILGVAPAPLQLAAKALAVGPVRLSRLTAGTPAPALPPPRR